MLKNIFLGIVVLFCIPGFGADVNIAPNNSLVVNKKPFFMIGAWAVNQNTIKKMSDMGVNTFIGENPWSGMSAEAWLSLVEKENKFAIINIKSFSENIKKSPALLSWMHGDEPDIYSEKVKKSPQTDPSVILANYADIKKKDPAHPVFVNFGDGMATGQMPVKPSVYQEFFKGADFVSLDVYPVNYIGDDQLHVVAKGVDRMKKYASNKKPVNIIIECTKIRPKKGERDCRAPSPEELRLQIWLSIVHGANGVSYFCHEMIPYKCGEVDISIQPEMKKQNARMTALTEVLCAEDAKREIKCSTEGEGRVEILAKEINGKLYIIAVNARKQEGKAKIEIANFKNGEAVVNEEDRKIAVKSGILEDSFKPYDVHIYELAVK